MKQWKDDAGPMLSSSKSGNSSHVPLTDMRSGHVGRLLVSVYGHGGLRAAFFLCRNEKTNGLISVRGVYICVRAPAPFCWELGAYV